MYFPVTEELAADEMRVIACGSGMPMPRLKQAVACFLIEPGNGEKYLTPEWILQAFECETLPLMDEQAN